MSRFKYLISELLQEKTNNSKIVGIFPFNTLVDYKSSDIYSGKIEFLATAIEGLKRLASNNFTVILFVNQFRDRPISFEHFQSLNQAVENFVKSTGVTVGGLYWCPGSDKKDPFVVPNPGMFNRVSETLHINWKDVPVISTSNNDLFAASRANATAIKIGNGPYKGARFDSFLDWVTSSIK